jgi:hypothetical protein
MICSLNQQINYLEHHMIVFYEDSRMPIFLEELQKLDAE